MTNSTTTVQNKTTLESLVPYLKRYREILLYAFLVGFFATGTFIVSFIVADQGKEDSTLINISGRQRTLSLKVAKSIIEIRLNALTGEPYITQVRELQSAYEAFNMTNNAFENGGTVLTADGKDIDIEPLKDDSARAILKQANEVWNGYKEAVHLIVESKHEFLDPRYVGNAEMKGEELDSLTLLQTANFASENSAVMLNMMESLTERLAEVSAYRAKLYRQGQILGIFLLITVFSLAVWRVGKSLFEQDQEIKKYSDGLENLVSTRTEELEASQKELVHMNENLEDLVEDRTKELKESQAQLIQSEKMASLGQMVAGVAHEINTPLGFVQNNIFELRSVQKELTDLAERFAKTHGALMGNDATNIEKFMIENESVVRGLNMEFFKEAAQLFDESNEGLERIKDLVVNLKNFSRLDEADMKDSDINSSLESTLKIAHNFLKHRVTVVKEYGELPIVKCYPSQLNQVFLNLITNAAQACEKQDNPDVKGIITIRTAYKDGNVMIDVADNGTGIPPEHLSKIFEPFFTTKPVGSGTGLGLSIVYKIIQQHKGTISVDSTVGKGTTFKIILPLTVTKNRISMFADEGHPFTQPSY
ncbi:MAG: GHKL domain-containing protein [Chlorobiales bacterium]|nr:GHKL domain-containing protein [Chlorobiales bacterium]